jgi:outer membrane receptor for monomeric catechols
MTKDGKTIVPRTLMREQADFSLNGALRNVPGINRR